jgi:hypothetical protein
MVCQETGQKCQPDDDQQSIIDWTGNLLDLRYQQATAHEISTGQDHPECHQVRRQIGQPSPLDTPGFAPQNNMGQQKDRQDEGTDMKAKRYDRKQRLSAHIFGSNWNQSMQDGPSGVFGTD